MWIVHILGWILFPEKWLILWLRDYRNIGILNMNSWDLWKTNLKNTIEIREIEKSLFLSFYIVPGNLPAKIQLYVHSIARKKFSSASLDLYKMKQMIQISTFRKIFCLRPFTVIETTSFLCSLIEKDNLNFISPLHQWGDILRNVWKGTLCSHQHVSHKDTI